MEIERQIAELEKRYLKGEISQEEYNKRWKELIQQSQTQQTQQTQTQRTEGTSRMIIIEPLEGGGEKRAFVETQEGFKPIPEEINKALNQIQIPSGAKDIKFELSGNTLKYSYIIEQKIPEQTLGTQTTSLLNYLDIKQVFISKNPLYQQELITKDFGLKQEQLTVLVPKYIESGTRTVSVYPSTLFWKSDVPSTYFKISKEAVKENVPKAVISGALAGLSFGVGPLLTSIISEMRVSKEIHLKETEAMKEYFKKHPETTAMLPSQDVLVVSGSPRAELLESVTALITSSLMAKAIKTNLEREQISQLKYTEIYGKGFGYQEGIKTTYMSISQNVDDLQRVVSFGESIQKGKVIVMEDVGFGSRSWMQTKILSQALNKEMTEFSHYGLGVIYKLESVEYLPSGKFFGGYGIKPKWVYVYKPEYAVINLKATVIGEPKVEMINENLMKTIYTFEIKKGAGLITTSEGFYAPIGKFQMEIYSKPSLPSGGTIQAYLPLTKPDLFLGGGEAPISTSFDLSTVYTMGIKPMEFQKEKIYENVGIFNIGSEKILESTGSKTINKTINIQGQTNLQLQNQFQTQFQNQIQLQTQWQMQRQLQKQMQKEGEIQIPQTPTIPPFEINKNILPPFTTPPKIPSFQILPPSFSKNIAKQARTFKISIRPQYKPSLVGIMYDIKRSLRKIFTGLEIRGI